MPKETRVVVEYQRASDDVFYTFIGTPLEFIDHLSAQRETSESYRIKQYATFEGPWSPIEWSN